VPRSEACCANQSCDDVRAHRLVVCDAGIRRDLRDRHRRHRGDGLWPGTLDRWFRRHGYGTENLSPFDLSLAVVGTGPLWVGWFGFNGGSAPSANSRAAMAIIATHLAARAGALI
jgi:hypothetical protein